MDGTCIGGKEVGGGGKWRGGRELRGEGGSAMQEGREHAKKRERWEEGKEEWGCDEGETCVGKRGKGREGVEETSRIVTSSEDARLVVRVLHVLHRAVICRQTRTKRLAAIHCATVVSGLHVSDTSLLFILRNLEKSQVGNPMQSLPPGNHLHRFLR